MIKRLLESFPVRVGKRYADAQGGNWAIIIAWNAFFAFFPMVLLTVTVVGLLLQDPSTRQGIESQAVSAFPSCRGPNGCSILQALDSFREKTGFFAVVGFLGLLWTGSGLFGAIDQGLNALYPCKPRDLIPQKLMSFGMVVLFTVLAVPLVLSGSALSLLEALPVAPSFLRGGVAAPLIQFAAGALDATILFGSIYYVVPHRRQKIRQVLPGAVTAGILFEGFTLLFPLYFAISSASPQWGQTFSFIFLLLFYFYVLGNIVVLGAAVNAERHPGEGACAAEGAPAGGLTGRTAKAEERKRHQIPSRRI